MHSTSVSGVAASLLLAVTLTPAADDAPFAQIARPQPRADGAPRASDVCFSTRWPRPLNPADKWDAFKVAREFHATRLDWLYLSGQPERDKAFVAKFTAADSRSGARSTASRRTRRLPRNTHTRRRARWT